MIVLAKEEVWRSRSFNVVFINIPMDRSNVNCEAFAGALCENTPALPLKSLGGEEDVRAEAQDNEPAPYESPPSHQHAAARLWLQEAVSVLEAFVLSMPT